MKHLSIPAISLLLAAGSAPAQLQVIRQGRESADNRGQGDEFGAALAVGDFNGDGYGELATGSPGEGAFGNHGDLDSGIVVISRGNKLGIAWSGATRLRPADAPSIPSNDANFRFGSALASGDFNGDGRDDLAVGAPGQEKVFIYYGSAQGLGAVSVVFTSDSLGIATNMLADFGDALAAGRLAGDAYDDLVIGAPRAGLGRVFVLKGSAAGLTSSGGLVINPGDLPQPIPNGSLFGASLAIGNVAGFAPADLLIGAPNATANGHAQAGMVALIPGSETALGLTVAAAVTYSQADTGAGNPAPQNRFGASVVIGNFFNDGGEHDFVIGCPGNDSSTGRVYLAKGQLLGPLFTQTIAQLPLEQESGDTFGETLAAADQDGDGFDDLAVGSPGEDMSADEGPIADGTPDLLGTGRVQIFRGGVPGINPSSPQDFWYHYVNRTPEAGVKVGAALAGGRITPGARRSILIGAPGKENDRGEVIDFAPWRQPAAPQITSGMAVSCEGEILWALRPFDRVKIASTTKTMTVLLACEATQKPFNDPGFRPFLGTYPIEPWLPQAFPPTTTCSAFKFVQNDVVTFEALMRTCIMVSGNDSAMAIADVVTGEISTWTSTVQAAPQFVKMMNDRAAQIGMNETLFTNPPGIDSGDPYSTAWDMYLLSKEAMKNPRFRDIVGRTSFAMNHLVPDGNFPGSMSPGVTLVGYGWLQSLRNSVPSAVGIKPGSTPGAGSTGVMAAPDRWNPDKLAFASYFGAVGSDLLGGSRAARPLQLALTGCSDTPPGPGGYAKAPVHTHGVRPLIGSPAQVALQLPGTNNTMADGSRGTAWTLDVQSASRDAAQNVDVLADYRGLFDLAPAGTTQDRDHKDWILIDFAGIIGFEEITISNTGMEPMELEITGLEPTPRALLLPAVQKVREAAARTTSGLHMEIRNTSRTVGGTITIELNGVRFRPSFGAAAPWRSSHRFFRSVEPIQETLHAAFIATGPVSPEPLTLVLQPDGSNYFYPHPVNMDRMALTNGAAGPLVQLDWSAPENFYSHFRVFFSPDMNGWTPLATVPAGSSALRSWTGPQPAGSRGFFRVEGTFEP